MVAENQLKNMRVTNVIVEKVVRQYGRTKEDGVLNWHGYGDGVDRLESYEEETYWFKIEQVIIRKESTIMCQPCV